MKSLKEKCFRLMIRMPLLSAIAAKRLKEVDNTIAHKFSSTFGSQTFYTQLPLKGRSSDQILEELLSYQKIGKIEWRSGRASGLHSL